MRKKIVFMGVGALGSNAAVLCRNLDADLWFIDDDRVESKNLSAQAYVKQSLGKNKAMVLKAQFLNFWGIGAYAYSVRCTKDNVRVLCENADLVIDCFDNIASRRVLSEHCRPQGGPSAKLLGGQAVMYLPKGVPLVHAAIAGTGDFGLVRWDERFVPDAEGKEGEATCEGGEHLPFIGALAGALARVVQEFLKTGAKRDVMVSANAVITTCFERSAA
jgi:hypothetical protein